MMLNKDVWSNLHDGAVMQVATCYLGEHQQKGSVLSSAGSSPYTDSASLSAGRMSLFACRTK